MPGPKECNKILDPIERKKCLNYEGKYAKKGNSKPLQGSLRSPKGQATGGGY